MQANFNHRGPLIEPRRRKKNPRKEGSRRKGGEKRKGREKEDTQQQMASTSFSSDSRFLNNVLTQREKNIEKESKGKKRRSL